MEDMAMADQALSEAKQDSFQKSDGASPTARDQIASASKELKDKAADIASSSSDAIRDRGSDFADAARDVGSYAADRFKEGVEDRKDAGARYVNGIAEAMRRAAREFDEDLPVAGTYLRKGASQVDIASEALKNGDLNNLLRDARDFARRQPTAFLGLAVLAGFGVVRFLKSSAEHSESERSYADTHGLERQPRAAANPQGGRP
jgi:hypothetical protein